MGKLVAPVYQLSPRNERILSFRGYNTKAVIEDGEMRDMYNLASDEFPCLAQRKPRGFYETGISDLHHPTSMIVKDKKLAIIDDGAFYYNGELYPELNLSDDTQMVAINTKICFFPEKVFFDVKSEVSGSLEGGIYKEDVTVKVTDSTITFPNSVGLTAEFKAGDVVVCTASDARLNISAEIEDLTDSVITFPGDTFISLASEGESEISIKLSEITISRSCPDLDYVMESNNRLWGVSNQDNTIYACKLGDPTNWYYYQGTNMDSFAAEQGTDGEWTGCAAYTTHLLFFKEDYIHKVYGSKPSTYQIETAQCHALEKGSNRSVCIINEAVLYKSRLGIMAYTGGTPTLISECFGIERFTDVVAGTDGIKYFASALKNNEPETLVYDMEKGLWHKEDNTRVREFCYHNGKLLYIDEKDAAIYEINSDNPLDEEKNIRWHAELGPFDEFIEEKKIYSKLKMRIKLEDGSSVIVYVKIDNGQWEMIDQIDEAYESAVYVPIVPRRCNKFSVKLEGIGRCRIESLVREYRDSTIRKDVK